MATTTDLISSIKLQGSFPSTDSLFSNQNYLSILDREQLATLTPLLLKLNEEYFVTEKDYPVVANQSSYRIPKRAAGAQLRDVQLISTNGNVTGLTRLLEDDRTSSASGPLGYYLKGNSVLLSPTPTTANGDVLRLLYVRRPSKFVLPIACAQIISIDTALNQIVVSSVPSTMTTATLVDFIQADSPYDLLQMDASIVGVSGTTISFSSLPTDLAVNDFISLAGETCVPMLPEELIVVLVQAALCTCLSSKKDKSVELELQKLEQLKTTFIEMLVPRVKSDDKRIVNKNSFF